MILPVRPPAPTAGAGSGPSGRLWVAAQGERHQGSYRGRASPNGPGPSQLRRVRTPKPVRGNASSRDPDPLRDLQVEEGDDDVLAERVAPAIDNESHDPPAVSSLDPGSNSANIRASKAKLTKLFIFTSLGAVGGMVPTSE